MACAANDDVADSEWRVFQCFGFGFGVTDIGLGLAVSVTVCTAVRVTGIRGRGVFPWLGPLAGTG
jgi:hypothetical protein